ncbi:MAG TPA: BA14K family protein [Candidatus Acidoferrales bacterium]|nr:BA14K family protein [Candidatus Acidoferrales bacterium]
MSKLGILGVTALSLSLAVATPALAAEMRGGGGMHAGGGNFGGVRGGAAFSGARANFSGAQASVGRTNFAGRGGQVASQGQVAQGGFRQDGFRDRDRGFGAGAGFLAGAAAGAALGYDYGYPYPYYYGDDYAYDDGDYFAPGPVVVEPGPAVVVGENAVPDPSYCAQRYRSYDPASGTYLGFDGLRHPCP